MRHLYRVLAPFAAILIALPAAAQANHTTNITLAKMYANGVPVPYGVVCAVPANGYSNPLTFSEQTWGVVTANSQFCGNVVNGAIAGGINVPDANQTNLAAPISYNFTLQLTNSSGVPTSAPISIYNSVGGVTGPTFVLDNYAPSVSTPVPVSNTFGYGSSVPTSCTSPSIWTQPGSSTILVCNGGIYVAPTGTGVNIGTTPGTVAAGNDPRILSSLKSQGTWSSLVAYSADDLVVVGAGVNASSYYSITPGIGTNTANPPASSSSAWQLLGTPTSPTVTATTAMAGLDYWIPFSSGNANDVTGNGHNGTVAGSGTAAAYVLGGIQPNGQTVSIPSASGRPSFGFCAYFPQGQGPLNYGYFYSVAAGGQTGYNIGGTYGPLGYNAQTGALNVPIDHYAYAYWPEEGSSNGTPLSQSANGYVGNHCVESIPGAATGNIVVDGKEVAYATQASTVSSAVGGAQLAAPMIVAGGNGTQTGLPITVYSVWGTPAGSVDTVAQASARTAFEVARLQALGIPFGLGSGLNATATDSSCDFDGTSIDQAFEAGGVPVSQQLTLTFPCTLHDFSITGQPEADMDAALPDRAGRYFHVHAPRNIAWNGGVVNSLLRYNDTPQQALNELVSWNRQMHALGYKTIASTMLSNGGTNASGTAVDTLAQQFNQLLLSYADEFDWIANPAAWPQLGATGAFSNTTYFNADGGSPTHPTAAGSAIYVAAEQTAFNGVYPSVTRTIVGTSGTTQFSQNPSDRVIVANCSAACALFLLDANNANFNAKGKLTVQNVGTANVTLAAVTGETVGTAQTLVIPAGSSTSIIPYEANFTTGGANWIVSGGGGSGSVSTVNGVAVGSNGNVQLTLANIPPAPSIASFTGCGTTETGTSVASLTFTLGYANGTPSAVQITNSDGVNSPFALASPFTSAAITGPFQHTAAFTLPFVAAATFPSSSASATCNEVWANRYFGGIGTAGATGVTASGTSASLTGATGTLTSAGLGSPAAGQTAGAIGSYTPSGQSIYLLVPGCSHTFKDTLTGFSFSTSTGTPVTYTNAQGASITGQCLYQSASLSGTYAPAEVN